MIDINAVRTDPTLAKVVQAEFRRAVGMIKVAGSSRFCGC